VMSAGTIIPISLPSFLLVLMAGIGKNFTSARAGFRENGHQLPSKRRSIKLTTRLRIPVLVVSRKEVTVP
jgi:hypothetical protein